VGAYAASVLVVPPPVRVALGPHALAVVRRRAGGARVAFTLDRLRPGLRVKAFMQTGSCGGSVNQVHAAAGGARVDGRGHVAWSAVITYETAPVPWPEVLNGYHVLEVVAAGKVVACGAVPRTS
jgi:hypothetical protein